MTIGIEAERANHPKKTGVEHYAHQLILHLAKIDSENKYILYLRSQPEAWIKELPKNFSYKVMPFPFMWTQIRLSLEMLFNPVDVLFIPASALPLIHPKNSVVTIHDSAFLFYPDTFTWFNRNFLHWSYKFVCRFASKVIAVSEATKQDLLKFYKVFSDKIAVVHHGYSESKQFQGQELSNDLEHVLPEKFILFLSTLQPRKNLEGLIDAFRELKNEHPDLPHKLVVIGRPGWKFESILQKIERNKDIVVYLNYVSEADKWTILSKAKAMVMPSFYEGFGMWILEGFEAGTPVLTSNVSSMPEVGADAALYFNPANGKDIKNTLGKVLLDDELAESLVKKGKERLKDFSWEKCAQETLRVITAKNK